MTRATPSAPEPRVYRGYGTCYTDSSIPIRQTAELRMLADRVDLYLDGGCVCLEFDRIVCAELYSLGRYRLALRFEYSGEGWFTFVLFQSNPQECKAILRELDALGVMIDTRPTPWWWLWELYQRFVARSNTVNASTPKARKPASAPEPAALKVEAQRAERVAAVEEKLRFYDGCYEEVGFAGQTVEDLGRMLTVLFEEAERVTVAESPTGFDVQPKISLLMEYIRAGKEVHLVLERGGGVFTQLQCNTDTENGTPYFALTYFADHFIGDELLPRLVAFLERLCAGTSVTEYVVGCDLVDDKFLHQRCPGEIFRRSEIREILGAAASRRGDKA